MINNGDMLEGGAVSDGRIRVLLVDDQPIIAEAVRRMLDGERDIDFFYCQNPLEALKTAAQVKPTVVLQDLVMPDVDGLTLAKYFRANPATRDIPLIVLSSKEEPSTKYKAFENGANDYMVKLPDKLEVIARIRYHSKAYINFCERNIAMARLQESQNLLRSELEQADAYVKSLLPAKIDNEILKTDWIFRTSTQLGGDCFGYERVGEDNFSMFLLDVCGHGVGAALLSVSVMNVLRSQSLPDVDFTRPSQVLAALNNAFDMEKQNNMYFTLWFGVYNPKTRKLSFASGGHPPALLDCGGGKFERLSTGGMIVGAMPDMSFAEKTVDVPRGAGLYIFSDGVYELRRAQDGRTLGFDEFEARLADSQKRGGDVLENLFAQAAQIQNSERFEDDYSMCRIIFK